MRLKKKSVAKKVIFCNAVCPVFQHANTKNENVHFIITTTGLRRQITVDFRFWTSGKSCRHADEHDARIFFLSGDYEEEALEAIDRHELLDSQPIRNILWKFAFHSKYLNRFVTTGRKMQRAKSLIERRGNGRNKRADGFMLTFMTVKPAISAFCHNDIDPGFSDIVFVVTNLV